MDAIDFELNVLGSQNFSFSLKWDSEIWELCLKQRQGFNARGTPPYSSIYWVPPPGGGMESEKQL